MNTNTFIEWKKVIIDGIPTIYSITEYGNIRNDNTMKIIKPCINTSDRPYVCLYINGSAKIMLIQKLVYETFIGPIPNGMTIDHIDENFLNNHYTNLRLLSRRDNIKAYLANHPDAFDKKYTDDNIVELCKLLKSGMYYKYAADKLNIPKRYVYDILRGKRRKSIVSKYEPFPRTAYRHRLIREIDYEYIIKCIIDGMTTKEIAESMDAEYIDANINLISKIRHRIGIADPRYFEKSFIEDIDKLISDGKTNQEIYQILSINFNKRISWLMSRERKRLGIPNNNFTIGNKEEKDIIISDIKSGLSNNEILSHIGKDRNQYYINLFGKLRKNIKKKNRID